MLILSKPNPCDTCSSAKYDDIICRIDCELFRVWDAYCEGCRAQAQHMAREIAQRFRKETQNWVEEDDCRLVEHMITLINEALSSEGIEEGK